MSERTDDARNAPEDRPAGARLSLGRRRLFGLVSWLLPLAVLLGAELAGRWRGYGGYPPIFRHYGSEGGVHWYGTNAPGVNSFFVQHLPHAGGMRGFAFATPKPPGTVRIVFIGESAMLGYPQEPSLTNSAFLASMLQDLWGPSRPVEVLNFGALAMASFPVLQFLDAALDHQPDLVVILCGNNEFYGAYGVASLHRAGASPAAMRLVRAARGLALVQWLEGRMAGAPEEGPARPQRAMEAMAAVRQVGPTDPLRRAAGRTLGTHLGKMVRLCAARRVPVIVCTVPTNERGMFPIGLDLPPPLPAERIREFGRHVDRAEASLVPDPAGAARELQAAIALYDQHARSRFLLARAWTALGEHERARAEYVRARDLDAMPWRATSAAGDAARGAAREGGILCDMESAFRRESPGGSIGWELMDDYAHFSLRGQALFARTIARAMADLPGRLHVDAAAIDRLPDWETYADRLGRTASLDYAAAIRLRLLFDIPLMRRSNPEGYERTTRECDRLLAGMSETDRRAVQEWQALRPSPPISAVVGYHRMMARDYAGAVPLLATARASVSEISMSRLHWTWYQIQCLRHLHAEMTPEDLLLGKEAIQTGERLRRFERTAPPMAAGYLGMAYHLVGNDRAAIDTLNAVAEQVQGEEGAWVVLTLAAALARAGEIDRAREVLSRAEGDETMAEAARRMLATLPGRSGRPAGPQGP